MSSVQYDDLALGDELEPRIVEDVRGEDMKLIAALLQDPYPPHYDERFAEELGYPDLLNQGPVNFSYLLQTVARHLEKPSDVRSYDLQFRDMVFAGDTVVATATVADKRTVDGDGLVEFDVALARESDDSVAVEGTVTARLPRD